MRTNNIEFAPQLHPTESEFSDFYSYMKDVEDKYGSEYGLVKIVPPKSWKARTSDYENSLNDYRLIGPIEQNAYGKGGLYELLMIPKKAQNFEEFKRKASLNDVDPSKCSVEEVEQKFWKNLPFSSPIYGADIQDSLMDSNIKWNLSNLPSLLNLGLNEKISGVNSSYLYFGAWKTMFAWHKEDLDLYSINYLHSGKPKFWYGIARSDSPILEKFMKNKFPENLQKCSEYLRHKTLIANPYLLTQDAPGIKIRKCNSTNEG